MVLMGYSGAGGKLIHKKTISNKSRDPVPLKHRVTNFFLRNSKIPVLKKDGIIFFWQNEAFGASDYTSMEFLNQDQ
jgi:hypothetical protein